MTMVPTAAIVAALVIVAAQLLMAQGSAVNYEIFETQLRMLFWAIRHQTEGAVIGQMTPVTLPSSPQLKRSPLVRWMKGRVEVAITPRFKPSFRKKMLIGAKSLSFLTSNLEVKSTNTAIRAISCPPIRITNIVLVYISKCYLYYSLSKLLDSRSGSSYMFYCL